MAQAHKIRQADKINQAEKRDMDKVPSRPMTGPGEAQPSKPPEVTAPPEASQQSGADAVPVLPIDPEGLTGNEAYGPPENPDSPELTGLPGITEISPDADSEEILEAS